MSEAASENKKLFNGKKLTAVGICGGIILLFALYMGYAAGYDKVYPNTYLGEEKVSGLTYGEAEEKIKLSASNTQLPDTIDFTLEGEDFLVETEKIELIPDISATLSGAVSNKKEQNVFSRAAAFTKSLFGKKELTLAYSYNEKKLDKAIKKVAKKYEISPVKTSYTAENGTLTVTKGHSGKVVDKTNLKDNISAYAKKPYTPIALKLKAEKEEDFDFDAFYKEITSDPRDAYYEKDAEGNVLIVPDKPKIKVNKSQLKALLKGDEAVVSIDCESSPAKVTEKDLKDALFSGVMGSWTSYFTASNRPRSANVALAASRIDGTVLLPGESFSYDKAVGPRTSKNGFQIAGVYINNKVEQGIGGGVCQPSSTLYSAVLYANLEIVSRTSHSLPVSYMPPGQDATIAEGSIDFIFKNNTNHPVKISAAINGGSITCKIIGTPVVGQKVVINNTTTAVYEPKIEIATDPSVPKGYKKTVLGSRGSAVSSSRTVYQNEKVVSTQRLTNSVYNATPTVVTVNPEDKNTPPEGLTEYSAAVNATPPEETEQEGGGEASAPMDTPVTEATDGEVIEI